MLAYTAAEAGGEAHLHVSDHFCGTRLSAFEWYERTTRLTIVTLGLLAEAGEESLAAKSQ